MFTVKRKFTLYYSIFTLLFSVQISFKLELTFFSIQLNGNF